MHIKAVRSSGLAHSSYYVYDHGEAFVIDPRRDVDEYINLAKVDCAYIKYVFETHRNEDYVSGSLELKEIVDVEICHSKETAFTYGDHFLSNYDSFKVGNLTIRCLWTPGHTFDSMCYVLYDTKFCEEALAVFTGDTMFIGDVGRTDLLGEKYWNELSGKLYNSIHEKILPLGDHVVLYPSHTAGSICGSQISNRQLSTIGYEKHSNSQLILGKDEFIENRLNNIMLFPPYFKRMEEWNLDGAPLIRNILKPKMLRPSEFLKETQKSDIFILDTRQPDAFAGSHIPKSVNIWLWGTTYYPGWVIDYDQKILLVCERKEDAITAITYLRRIGYDEIIGRTGGYPIQSIKSMHVETLKEELEKGQVKVIDVREEHEFESGHIKESENIYVGEIMEKLDKIPKGKLVCITCRSGGRGGIAASLLKEKGYEVSNLLGGMNAWKTLKQPVEVTEKKLVKRTPVCPF
ncbi:MAG: MBL fold metallo-hydrolase [Promethearchaeota archaeon]|jgi:hydroxyacylglutathione hydrolase